MAEIKLNLREPNAQKETPINVIIRYNGQKLVYSSGKRIHPSMWDNLSQKAKRSKDSTSSELLNGSLRLITQGVYEEIECYQKNNQQRFPEPKELKAILDLRFSRIADARKQNFFEFIEWFSMVYAPMAERFAFKLSPCFAANWFFPNFGGFL